MHFRWYSLPTKRTAKLQLFFELTNFFCIFFINKLIFTKIFYNKPAINS